MAKIYYDSDCNLGLLKGKTVAIIGYGSQGHAHAQNLRDSGIDVVVGLPEGSKSRQKAVEDGLRVENTDVAAKMADVVMMLVPDQLQQDIYETASSRIWRKEMFLLLPTALQFTLKPLFLHRKSMLS